jgi:hypothetical protein
VGSSVEVVLTSPRAGRFLWVGHDLITIAPTITI